ncbi:MAG: uridine diphosphate-N-acetylglucosamine-binding protein YvcK [Armatimonadota bacterium]
MIRRPRLRHVLGPTRIAAVAVLLVLVGLTAVFAGSVMAFNIQIQTITREINTATATVIGLFATPDQTELFIHWLGGILMLLGIFLAGLAIRNVIVHFVETLSPSVKGGRVGAYVRKQQLSQGPHIVALGGGTGLSTLLRGLKQHSSNITAIVTVTDDGGSSGQLILDKGMIPPGDIRNCLVALADAEKAMTDLFQHRFIESGALNGHSMGNLLIAALVDQARGDFEQAINIASDVLAIRGKVMPSTLDHVGLRARLDDDSEVSGETAIVQAGKKIRELQLSPGNVSAYPAALEAIADAELICIGPGSVYTSVIPNLLIPGMKEALKSSKAIKVYICNVMTQPGESDNLSASEHASAILQQVKDKVFDYVLINTGIPDNEVLEKYKLSGQNLVEPDTDRLRAMGLKVIQGNFISTSDVVRHDPVKVVSRLMAQIGL